jgi:hypothetical protein
MDNSNLKEANPLLYHLTMAAMIFEFDVERPLVEFEKRCLMRMAQLDKIRQEETS